MMSDATVLPTGTVQFSWFLQLDFLYVFSQRSYMETKGWDVFRNLPPEQDSGSEAMNKRCLAITVRTLKVITYIVSFAVVLAGCVMSKGTILFMTSQIRPHKTILYCNKELERDKQYQAEISTPEQVNASLNRRYLIEDER